MSSPALDTELLRLRALVEASQLVFSSLDLDELLDNILRAATSIVGAERGTVYLLDHATKEIWSRVTSGRRAERVEIRLPFGQGMAGHTAVSGERLHVPDVRQSPLFDPETDRRTGFHTRNALCIPIRDRSAKVVAVIQLLNKHGGFEDEDAAFLELMGVHVSQALANVQAQHLRVERQKLLKEMQLAAEIQRRLLPSSLPKLTGISLCASMVPSRRIGGDYYDAVPLPNGAMLLVLADVSGKGVPAALVVSNLQAALWATVSLGGDLERWAGTLSEALLRRLDASRYVTAFFAVIAPDGASARYLNAGHPPALLCDGSGVWQLDSTGPPLGLVPGSTWTASEVALMPGSSLLMYSDGLTEASDASGNEMGVEGLSEIFVRTVSLCEDGPDAAQALLAEIDAWNDPEQDRDDRTLVLLRRT